jgi:hypothetical protein
MVQGEISHLCIMQGRGSTHLYRRRGEVAHLSMVQGRGSMWHKAAGIIMHATGRVETIRSFSHIVIKDADYISKVRAPPGGPGATGGGGGRGVMVMTGKGEGRVNLEGRTGCENGEKEEERRKGTRRLEKYK